MSVYVKCGGSIGSEFFGFLSEDCPRAGQNITTNEEVAKTGDVV